MIGYARVSTLDQDPALQLDAGGWQLDAGDANAFLRKTHRDERKIGPNSAVCSSTLGGATCW